MTGKPALRANKRANTALRASVQAYVWVWVWALRALCMGLYVHQGGLLRKPPLKCARVSRPPLALPLVMLTQHEYVAAGWTVGPVRLSLRIGWLLSQPAATYVRVCVV